MAQTQFESGSCVELYREGRFYSAGILVDMGQMKSGRVAYQAVLVKDLHRSRTRPVVYFSDEFKTKPSSLERIESEIATTKNSGQATIENLKSRTIKSDPFKGGCIVPSTELNPGDYIGLYTGNQLYGTGMLRDIGDMISGRILYEVLLVINIFQRQYTEIHFSSYADVRPVNLQQVKDEIEIRKTNLQLSLEKMLNHDVSLLEKQDLSRIYGG
jgi:hypothetical protein